MAWLRDASGDLMVDFVGRVETISDDIKHIEEEIGTPINLAHTNKSVHRHYRDEYCAERCDFVTRHFKEDIETFGCDF